MKLAMVYCKEFPFIRSEPFGGLTGNLKLDQYSKIKTVKQFVGFSTTKLKSQLDLNLLRIYLPVIALRRIISKRRAKLYHHLKQPSWSSAFFFTYKYKGT